MKFILICATGRSGSTTLQRIINTIKDSTITGEKHGAIKNLLECYANIKHIFTYTPKDKNNNFIKYDKLIEYKIKPAWYNCYNYTDVKNNIKNSIISILSNNGSEKVLGYKEIRWFDSTHLIDVFIELFPNTKVICHIDDNLDRQQNSGWWKNNPDAITHLAEYNKQLINYSKNNKNCYLSYMKNLFILNEMKLLFCFLGESLNEKKYNTIIHNNLHD